MEKTEEDDSEKPEVRERVLEGDVVLACDSEIAEAEEVDAGTGSEDDE